MLEVEKSKSALPYPLQVGRAGEERLNILNSLHNPFSKSFLESANIANSKRVLDIGCGTGEMTCWLAQQTKGEVLAIDISEEQLEIARAKALALNIKNIRFNKMSIFDIDSLDDKFDFIYCRFLLVFLQNPENVLATMHKCLDKNGILVSEEATVSVSFCYPPSPAFDKWLDLWRALRKANGTVLDLGLHLPEMFRKTGFLNIHSRLVQPVLSSTEEKRILALNVKEVTDSAIHIGYDTPEGMANLVDDLEELARDDSLFIGYIRNSQIYGHKS